MVVGLVPARTARDEVADRDQMGADAAGEGAVMRVWSRSNWASRTAAMALSRAAWAARCSAAFWSALSTVPAPVCFSEFGADQLADRQVEARMGAFRPEPRLAQLDLIGGRVDLEQEIALVDDVRRP